MTHPKANERISKVVGCEVTDYANYSNGFSFCVVGELNAYKSAYAYREMKVNLSKTSDGIKTLVQVYFNEKR
ncbi:hypothetical protein POP12_108 [Pectobacterium phage POP12]|nr:hypothetical protein POP12_108 [Pectobacterium phage POP12]